MLDRAGHPDFIAEVERSLGVLDAAVLVLSAVEGVQPQTVVIWRALQRVGVPTLLFVNKIDRAGADVTRVVEQVGRRLTSRAVGLTDVRGQGSVAAAVDELPLTDDLVVAGAAETDDRLLTGRRSPDRARGRAGRDPRRHTPGRAEPLFCGSAATGAGIPRLCRAVAELLTPGPEVDGELSGTVFAVDRDERGRGAWLRLWSGELHTRDQVTVAEAHGSGSPRWPPPHLAAYRSRRAPGPARSRWCAARRSGWAT